MLQKYLAAAEDLSQAQKIAGDMDENGCVNIFDLSMMKAQLAADSQSERNV